MKKSPLSTPSGSRGRQGYGWKSYNHKNRTGYGSVKSDDYQCISPNRNQAQHGNDFIPLNISTPVSEPKRHSANWYGSGNSRNHRNSGSGGFNHYRNNYHATPKANFNNSYSPYKHSGKQFHGQRKGFQRDAHRHVDISQYIDMKSFLEDPWAELTKKLNGATKISDEKLLKTEQSVPLQSNYINSELHYQRKSTPEFDDSQYSQESLNGSSIDISLGLDNTDASAVSKAESSIDLKFDAVKVSQDSKNESLQSDSENNHRDTQREDNVDHLCSSEINTSQKSI